MQCRLRNLSYSAAIKVMMMALRQSLMAKVDLEYTRDGSKVFVNNLVIGRMPIMLHSSKSDFLVLHNVTIQMSAAEPDARRACPAW